MKKKQINKKALKTRARRGQLSEKEMKNIIGGRGMYTQGRIEESENKQIGF